MEGQRDQRDRLCGRALHRSRLHATTCGSFAQIAAPGPRNGTGNVTYMDTTVTAGNTYFYRVWAVNAVGQSATPTNATSAIVPAIPAAPTNFTVSAVKSNGNQHYTATLNWAYPAPTQPTSRSSAPPTPRSRPT